MNARLDLAEDLLNDNRFFLLQDEVDELLLELQELYYPKVLKKNRIKRFYNH